MSSAGPGRREVAHRLFAAEYEDASLEYAESDEERAPNYVVMPSGARVNRLFVVGVLTAVEQVNEDTVRARIADPTGAFVVYAGQYQPDELAALQSLEAPAFLAVTGKANTFSPEGSDRVLTSVRPESVTEVDAETRDRWVGATAEHTLARVQTAADALGREERGDQLQAALIRDGVEPGLAEGVAKAIDHYGTTADYLGALRDLATQALEVVSGDRSEVESLETSPDEGDGAITASDLAELLDEERLGVTRAAGDVDVEALLEDESSDADGAVDEDEASDAGEAADEGGAVDAGEAVSEGQESVDDTDATDVAADSEAFGGDSTGEEEKELEGEGDEGVEDEGVEDEGVEDEGVEDEGVEDEGVEDEGEVDEGESSADQKPADSETEADDGDADTDDTPTDTATAGSDEETEPVADHGATEGEGVTEGDEATDDDELYEVDEAEREQIEEEYGVGFQNGKEVDDPGQAGIETDDAPPTESADTAEEDDEGGDGDEAEKQTATAGADDEAEPTPDADDDSAADAETDPESEGDESDGDADLEAVLLEEMRALDGDDGADREDLIDAVAEETGATVDAVDDAIDDALMSGKCYEPSEGTLKPI